MGLVEDAAYIGRLLDGFAPEGRRWHVDSVVPSDMRVGEVRDDGWVAWKLVPSTVASSDIESIERGLGVEFPPLFWAFMLARSHLFRGFKSARHAGTMQLPATPSAKPLASLAATLSSWGLLVSAGYLPFGEWGDSYGPMCFDGTRSVDDGDRPIVWFDHEELFNLGEEACRHRSSVLPLARPLYGSFRELLTDVFGGAAAG